MDKREYKKNILKMLVFMIIFLLAIKASFTPLFNTGERGVSAEFWHFIFKKADYSEIKSIGIILVSVINIATPILCGLSLVTLLDLIFPSDK